MSFLLKGVFLGLSAGIIPGPLLALVISETLKHGLKAGIRVSMAPLVTDLPIVLFSFFVLQKISEFNRAMGCISVAGGLVLAYMAYECLASRDTGWFDNSASVRSLKKGILANALSPHPYLFWFAIGSPIAHNAFNEGIFLLSGFIGGFYVVLVGSKVLLALGVSHSRHFLDGRAYFYLMKSMGALLCVFSALLFRDALKFFGVAGR